MTFLFDHMKKKGEVIGHFNEIMFLETPNFINLILISQGLISYYLQDLQINYMHNCFICKIFKQANFKEKFLQLDDQEIQLLQ